MDEQWKLSGDCNKCRRKNYCSKPCTVNKMNTQQLITQSILQNTMVGKALEMVNRDLRRW